MLNILGRSHDHGFDEPLGLLSDCHRRIEMFLESLQRIAREHAGGPLAASEANAIRNAQRYFAQAAPKHAADEEESLFPRMRDAAAAKGRGCDALERLEDDHQRADLLQSRANLLLDAWLRDGSLPRDQALDLISVLDALRKLYRAHIHVEESAVFPLAGELLSASELSRVGTEMRARRGLPVQK